MMQTPLAAHHRERGARMVPFAGYDMPLNYADGIVAEHLHCRAHACVFDVSHMGQLEIRARNGSVEHAAAALEQLVPADILGLAVGRQRYALLTNDTGGIRDDLMVAALEDRLLVVVNAACKQDDFAHLKAALADCEVAMRPDRALIALQGPQAGDVLAHHAPGTAAMRFMDVREMLIDEISALIVRSGYTGEDGFEIAVDASEAGTLFDLLLADERVKPAGLGARDTLRLEAGLCLMGSDLDETTSPVEAGLAWSIGRSRRQGGVREAGFPGAERILAELADGPQRRRVGLLAEGRAPVRGGAALSADGEAVGLVTSGGFGPSLNRPVAMGYVAQTQSAPGTELAAESRGRRIPVTVAPLPFVQGRQRRT